MKIVTKSLFESLNRLFAAIAACTTAGLLTCAVLANPVIDNVAAGNVSLQQTPGTTIVNQASQKAIINWQSFNIGHGESTHFNQPAGGVALNRISAAQGASQIYGSLTATGQIILMNAAGVYFGPSAYVNVGGLVATTANISDQNFMNGLYQFSKVGAYSGSIVNEGQIIAAQHGLVALVAPGVVNKGMIQANLGKVILASGEAFTLNFSGDSLVNFAVTAKTASPGLDKDGNPLPAGISNTGSIFANGGTIILSAQAVAGILDHMINMEGIAQTQSVYEDNGQIILSSDPDSGIVRVAANLDASGKGAGETGGNITITGHHILIDSPSSIDVSGDAGGGDVFVGGNYQGKGPLPNANATVMAPNAIIRADAITAGNGGHVILWADNVTKAYGSISARGGRLGGDGGFIETSGKNYLDVNGINISTLAPYGKTGMWLLDPTDLTISTGSTSNVTQVGGQFTANSNSTTSVLNTTTLTTQLASTDVTVQTTSGGTGGGSGDIIVANNINWSSAFDLTLSAYRNITINGGVTISNTSSSNAVLNLIANNEGALAVGSGNGTVTNSGTINMAGAVNVYYNPTSYAAPVTYTNTGAGAVTAFMYINSASELDLINDSSVNWDKNYALSKNIDASSIANFTPIGDSSTNFSGNFNGRNFSISNLTIDYPASSEPIGFIGINAGTIQNLSLINAAITGYDVNGILVGINDGTVTGSSTSGSISGFTSVGGLVGINNATITNSSSSATVTGTGGNYIGGLIGKNVTGSSVSDIFATGNVYGGDAYAIGGLMGSNEIDLNGSNHRIYYESGTVNATSGAISVGGLLGENYGVLSNFSLTSPVNVFSDGGAQLVGGLVGYNNNDISNSFVNANITGTGTKVGGLVGSHGNGTISSSYTVGSVVSDSYAGGLVGENATAITDSYSLATTHASSISGGLVGINFGTIDNSYSMGQVTGTSTGGLLAENYGTVNNSYWNTDTSGQATSVAGTGLDDSSALYQASYVGFNFSTIWAQTDGENYPYLQSFYPSSVRSILGFSSGSPGDNIRLAANGSVLDNTYVLANGSFYFLISSSALPDSTPLLLYNTSGGTYENAVMTAPAGGLDLTGVQLIGNTLAIGNNGYVDTITSSDVSTALGSINDSNIIFSFSGANLEVGTGSHPDVDLRVDSAFTLNGDVSSYTGGTGFLSFNNLLFLGVDSIITSDTGDVSFSNINSSGTNYSLTVNSSGYTNFGGDIGTTLALSSITTDATGQTVFGLSPMTITTNGLAGQTYNDPVTLPTPTNANTTTFNTNDGQITFGSTLTTGSTTINAGSGAITFTGAVDSGGTGTKVLILNSTGTTTFSAAVGSTTPFTSITTDSGGTTAINGGLITTSGAQTYNDAITLGSAATLNVDALTMANTLGLGSSQSLTINNSGTSSISGVISGTGTSAIIKNGAGTLTLANPANTYAGITTVNAGILSVGTLANQSSNSSIGTNTFLLNGGTLSYTGSTISVNRNYSVGSNGGTLQATNSGNTLTLTGTQNIAGSGGGANPLTVSVNAGNITLNPGTVATALSNLTVTGNGTGTLTLGTTSIYTGTTTVNSGTLRNGVANAIANTLLTVNNPGTYNMNGVANSISGLSGSGTVTNSGAAATLTDTESSSNTFSGDITGTVALTKAGAGTLILSGTNSSYSGATTISAGTLSIASVNNSGVNSSIGTGSTTPAISIGATGILQYTGSGHSTNRNINLTASGGTINASGSGSLTLNGNGTSAISGNTFNVVLRGTGSGIINGNITTTTGTLTKSDAGSWTLAGANNNTGTIAISTNGGTLNANSVGSLGTGTGVITVNNNSTLNIGFSNSTLSRTGTLTLNGSGDSGQGALTFSGTNAILSNAVTLGSNTIIGGSGSNARINGAINGSVAGTQSLTISNLGSYTFGSTTGATTSLSSLTSNVPTTFVGASITTTGNQTYNAAATLNAATITLNAGTGNISFASTIDSLSATARALVLNSTGTTTLGGAVGTTFALSTLTTNAGGTTAINGGTVTTTGTQTYNDSVRLGANTTINTTNSTVTFASPLTRDVSAAYDLTVNVGTTGNIALNSNIGGLGSPLGNLNLNTTGTTTLAGTANYITSLTTNSGGTTSISGLIDATGDLTFNDAVTLALGGNPSLYSTGSVIFNSTINGANDLSIIAASTITFNGIIGGTTAPIDLDVGSDGAINVNANITTSGNQTYRSFDFIFTGNRTLTTTGTNGNIGFDIIGGPLTWAGANTLSLNASGASGTISLPTHVVAPNGTLTLNAGDVSNSYNTIYTPTELTTEIDVNTFNLQSGQWVQISGSLPSFNATNFSVTGDRFIRALAGDGSIGNPYQITDIYSLQGIGSGSHTLASNFILANNIDLAPAATWNSGAGWDPMGSTSVPFSGSFDGNNYTLDNLTMSRAGQTDVGLFAESSNAASYSNLNMTNINISVGANSGALVGRGRGSFSNISLSGTITANGAFVGFLSGRYNSDSTETASNVTTSGTLTSSSTQVGGIFGSIRSNGGNFQMSNSSSSVNVTGTTDIGGLVGEFQGNGAVMTITSSHATGTVSGTTNVGGLVGRMQGNTINLNQNTVSNSYSTGSVTGTTNVGGLVGQMTMQTTGSGYNAVTGSYSSSAVTGTTRVGGLVGYANSSSVASTNDISNSYANGTLSANSSGISIGGLVGQTDSLATIDNSYSNIVSFSNTTGADNIGGLVGTNAGSVTDSHSITNITIANGSTSVGGLIGSNSSTGTVSNSYATGNIINNTTTAGLSGRLGGLVGDNLGSISGSYATGSITSSYSGQLGGLAGQNSGSISNSYSTGAVTGTAGFYFGGLVGQNNSTGTITNSFSSSQMTGYSVGSTDSSSIGGLVGYNDGSVSQSYATGAIVGNTAKNLGGLVGWNASGTITNSYSTGTITGISTVINGSALGGLVGLLSGGSITNSYSTGIVSASAGYTTLGGLVGNATGGTVTNSYWDTESSGQSSSAGGTGLTTTQMMSQASYTGWDFATVWNIVDGQSYPFLRAFYSTAPRAISGSTPTAAGTAVSFASNGAVLDTVYTSTNGNYYFLAGNNLISGVDSSIADGTAILAYLNSGSTVGNAVALAPVSNGSLSNFNISADNLTIGTTAASSMSNTSLATAVGALTSSTILYSALGNAITIGNNTYKNIAFNTTASTTFAVNGNINSTSGTTGSSITFNAAPSVNTTATLSAVTISFINGLTGNGNVTITGANSSNTLSMKSASSQTFNITGANSGSASSIGSFIGTIAFNNIQNIVGGDNGNTFNFSNNATMAGTLNGSNLNSTNTINLSAYNAAIKVVLSSTNDGVVRTMSDNLITTFANITHVNPNTSFGNTIYTPSGKGNNVYITGGRAGYINDPIYFTGVNSLIASSGGSVNFLANATFDPITGLYTVDGVTMSLSGFNSISGYTTTTSIDVSNIIQQPPTNAEQNVVSTNTSTSSWVLAGTTIDQNLTTMVTDINNEMDNDLQKVKINPYCYTTQ